MCAKCDNNPCLNNLVGEELVEGCHYLINNYFRNNLVSFHMSLLFSLDVYSILGVDTCVIPPKYVETLMKEDFSQEDGVSFVGNISI